MSRRAAATLLISAALAIAAVILRFCGGAVDVADGGATDGKKTLRAKAPPLPPLPDTIKIAFYNVENLFDFNLDGTEYDEYKPGWYGWNEETHRKRLRSAAEAVAAVGADAIGLCEVENANALAELQSTLDNMGAPYPYAAVAGAEKSATVTALLSRLPITEKRAIPVEGSRSILEAAIAGGGDTVRFFVNHWPSKRHPESKRVEAARALRRRLDGLRPDGDYVAMGDFNSNYDEHASFHTTGHDDTRGVTGICHVLKTITAGDRPGAPAKFICRGELPACGGCHYNAWLDVEENARMSYVYRGAKNTIDNMLLPPALFDSAGYSYLPGSFQAFAWGGRLLKDGAPYRWQMYFKGKQKYHKGDGYSDHLPITAALTRAGLIPNGGKENCADVDKTLAIGDFAASADGWVSGDSRFTVERDAQRAKTGSHSLHISGLHETENRTAARSALTPAQSQKNLTLNARGEGKLSIRLRRPNGAWAYHNAPNFGASKSAKYNEWKSDRWVSLTLPLPPLPQQPPESGNADDVEIELRAGKGERFSVWIDKVRLE